LKKREDICVIVQARLGSQRVPNKMIRPFSGTTLVDIVIDKVKQCKSFDIKNFYISVWEDELKALAKEQGVNIFERSERSAKSEGTPMTEMYDWWNKLPYKYCILISACTPFLKSETIDSFVEKYMSSSTDGQFAVIEKKNYFWNEDKNIITPLSEAVMNTKTVAPTYEAAHCLYAGPMSKIGQGIWMGDFNSPGEIELFAIDEKESFDIDYEWQFELCEKLWGLT
jgi:CMP-N-acetylneuraminic acid synthetase